MPLDISLREGGDVGKPIVEADPTALAARELTRVAQTWPAAAEDSPGCSSD